MKHKHDLGLTRTPEEEKKVHFAYLTKTTSRYKKIMSDLIDAGYEIQKKKKVTDKHFKLFEKAVREPYLVVFCHLAGEFLCTLSYTYEEAEEIFIRLSQDRDSNVRLNNITNLLRWPTKKIIDIVLKNGLNDKSTRVRAKVGDVISRLQLKRYARILPRYIEKEENVEVKKRLEYGLFWITHEYEVKKSEIKGYDLWIKVGTATIGLTITFKEYKDIDNVVAEIKKDEWNWRENYQRKKKSV